MKKNAHYGIIIMIFIVVCGVSFFAGMKYDQSKQGGSNTGFASLSPEDRQARRQQMGNGGNFGNAARGGGVARSNGGFTSGDVLSKDDKSITIKLSDGGSKIIFLSGTTKIMKSAEGTSVDLVVGGQVTISGSANSDGSINAQSIQVKPASPVSVSK